MPGVQLTEGRTGSDASVCSSSSVSTSLSQFGRLALTFSGPPALADPLAMPICPRGEEDGPDPVLELDGPACWDCA